jgi:hypothetical protein
MTIFTQWMRRYTNPPDQAIRQPRNAASQSRSNVVEEMVGYAFG